MLTTTRRRFKYAFAALIIFLASYSAATASTAASGLITFPISLPGGVVIFNHAGPRTAIPACGVNNPQRWALNVNTPAGQATLSMLLSAYALGKTVTLTGTGTCQDWGDTETVQIFQIDG